MEKRKADVGLPHIGSSRKIFKIFLFIKKILAQSFEQFDLSASSFKISVVINDSRSAQSLLGHFHLKTSNFSTIASLWKKSTIPINTKHTFESRSFSLYRR